MHRRRACSASPDDERASLETNRNVDSATHLVRTLGGEVESILRCSASVGVASGEVAALSFLSVADGQEPRAHDAEDLSPLF